MKFIYEYVLDALSAGERAALVTLLDIAGGGEGVFPQPGSKLFWSRTAVAGSLGSDWLDRAALDLAARALRTGMVEKAEVPLPGQSAGRCTLVAEPFFTPEELVILGGGNIARPLVRLAAMLGFAVTVVDDRPEFASGERFPEARLVVCENFARALEGLSLSPGTYVVIATRGHHYDLLCLERLAGRDLAYLGVIGSKRKVALFKEHLLSKGVPGERIAAVYMPIGLDIGAQTPEEIAVSIAAELVKVRRGGAARSLAEDFGGGQAPQGYFRGGSLAAQDIDLLRRSIFPIQSYTLVI